jgi:hypothetical protein
LPALSARVSQTKDRHEDNREETERGATPQHSAADVATTCPLLRVCLLSSSPVALRALTKAPQRPSCSGSSGGSAGLLLTFSADMTRALWNEGMRVAVQTETGMDGKRDTDCPKPQATDQARARQQKRTVNNSLWTRTHTTNDIGNERCSYLVIDYFVDGCVESEQSCRF